VAAVAEAYREPICAYLQLRFGISRDDADDLTQSFFAGVVSGCALERFDAARGRFRTYLRACVDNHVAHEWEAAHRIKRGGSAQAVPLSDADAAGLVVESHADTTFDREWARSVCRAALTLMRERLARRGRLIVYDVFERYDVVGAAQGERPTYQAIGGALAIPLTHVANCLTAARREFRTAVLDHLREQAGSDDELRAEARALLGVVIP
jgi:RNA polymerase sigma-70 factor (ECF subfamily)